MFLKKRRMFGRLKKKARRQEFGRVNPLCEAFALKSTPCFCKGIELKAFYGKRPILLSKWPKSPTAILIIHLNNNKKKGLYI